MIQLNINKLTEKLVFTVPLESDCRVMGVLLPLSAATGSIDVADLTDFITGQTNSKLSYIKKSFPLGGNHLNKVITIRGTGIKAVITKDDPELKKYRMYVTGNTYTDATLYEFPSIEYEDRNGATTFRYKVPKSTGYPTGTTFILQYWGIIDEPNLDTNLFINRGVNNVFESFSRLKTVTNVQELEKTGFGFFKLYSKGII